jgi:uncharacterized repeat protein (TIGR01451 family)
MAMGQGDSTYNYSPDYGNSTYNYSGENYGNSTYNYIKDDYGNSTYNYKPDQYGYLSSAGGYTTSVYVPGYAYGYGTGYTTYSKPIYFGGQAVYVPTQSYSTYSQPVYTNSYSSAYSNYQAPKSNNIALSTTYANSYVNNYGQTYNQPQYCYVNIYADKSQVTRGGQVKITWSASNASYVTLTGGTFSNMKVQTSGSKYFYPQQNVTYTAKCFTANGQSNTASTFVSIYSAQNYNYNYNTNTNYSGLTYLGADYPPQYNYNCYSCNSRPTKGDTGGAYFPTVYKGSSKSYTTTKTTPKKTVTSNTTKNSETAKCNCESDSYLSLGVQNINATTYGVVLKNVSTETLRNVSVRVVLPSQLTIVSTSKGTYTTGGREYSYTLPIMYANQTEQIVLTVSGTVSNDNPQMVNAQAVFTVPTIVKNGKAYQGQVTGYAMTNEGGYTIGAADKNFQLSDLKNTNTTTTTSSSTLSNLFTTWTGWLFIILGAIVVFAIIRFIMRIFFGA